MILQKDLTSYLEFICANDPFADDYPPERWESAILYHLYEPNAKVLNITDGDGLLALALVFQERCPVTGQLGVFFHYCCVRHGFPRGFKMMRAFSKDARHRFPEAKFLAFQRVKFKDRLSVYWFRKERKHG